MEEHEDEEDEEDEEDDDEEDESEEEEEVDSEKSDEEEEEEDEDEEDDEEEDNEMEKDNANSLQIKDAAADQVDIAEVDLQPKNIEINGLDPRKEDQITNGIEKNVDIETENTTLATENADLATEDMDMGTVAMDDDQSKDENNIKREDTITPDILENGIEINGTEKEEDIVGRMIRELMVT
jgi:hypothetical protein